MSAARLYAVEIVHAKISEENDPLTYDYRIATRDASSAEQYKRVLNEIYSGVFVSVCPACMARKCRAEV
jgi:hypothetical protein